MSTVPPEVQQKRLLRLTIAHYRRETCGEEEFHKWATGEHDLRAAKIHAKHGIEGYAMVGYSDLRSNPGLRSGIWTWP